MLEYLIKLTYNTFYIVVPFAMLLASERAAGRLGGGAHVIKRGFCAGLASALIYAALKRNTGFAVREYYDLAMLAVSLLSGVVLPFVSRAGRLRALALFLVTAGGAGYCASDIILYPFEFAVGMNSVFNTDFMFRLAGYCLGLALLFLTWLAIFRTASSLAPRRAFALWLASHAVLLAYEALTVSQILLGRNLIPRYKALTGLVIWMLSNVNAFVYAMTALALAGAVLICAKARSEPPAGSNPAEVRRSRFRARVMIRYCAVSAAGVALSLLIVTAGVTHNSKGVELSPPVELPADGDRIVIPLDMVNDGNLHRFVHKVGEGPAATDVRYIVIKKNDTAYGVGLDACDVCGPSGYYQRKGSVVCILCDVVMNTATIGLAGGCNPVPLKFGVESGAIVIKTADLAAEAYRF
jgi:uncharacterized membrane protein